MPSRTSTRLLANFDVTAADTCNCTEHAPPGRMEYTWEEFDIINKYLVNIISNGSGIGVGNGLVARPTSFNQNRLTTNPNRTATNRLPTHRSKNVQTDHSTPTTTYHADTAGHHHLANTDETETDSQIAYPTESRMRQKEQDTIDKAAGKKEG